MEQINTFFSFNFKLQYNGDNLNLSPFFKYKFYSEVYFLKV